LGGSVQVFGTITFTALILYLFEFPLANAVFFGFLVSLSSTAIVLKMLQEIVTIKEIPAQLDATDALAVAICHHFQVGSVGAVQIKIGSKKPGAGWESFVKDNPERVR
jgi:Kef-type K+ transport system membrane component KefB